jgi:hypothetical protein
VRLFFQCAGLPPIGPIALVDIQRFTVFKSPRHLTICSPGEDDWLWPRVVDVIGKRGIFVPAPGFQGPAGHFVLQAVEEDAIVPRLVLSSLAGAVTKVPVNAWEAMFRQWIDAPSSVPGGENLPLGTPVRVRVLGGWETGQLAGYCLRPSDGRSVLNLIQTCRDGDKSIISLATSVVVYIERI